LDLLLLLLLLLGLLELGLPTLPLNRLLSIFLRLELLEKLVEIFDLVVAQI